MRKFTFFLALMVAMVTTAKAQTFEVIDLASNADKMLYSNAPCTVTSWGDQFVGWHVLFDDNTETIFHSDYGAVGSVDGLDHYLRVDMGDDNKLSQFVFTYTTRSKNCEVNSPLKMVVEGSNEANGEYTKIADLTNLPTTNSTKYNSELLGTPDVAYRYIRFRVTETLEHQKSGTQTDPNGKVFFFIAEFGMSKLVDENVSAEEIAASIAKANEILAFEGVGYPTANPRATLQAAIDALEAEGSNENYSALQSAIEAYYATTDVVLPEVGKAYTITMVAKNGNKFYLNYTGEDVAMTARTNDELPESAVYVCEAGDNGAVAMKTNDGKYLAYHNKYAGLNWLQNGGNTKGFQDTKDELANITFAKIANGGNVAATNDKQLFGLLSWSGIRGIRTDNGNNENGYMVLKTDGSDYDGASAPFFNDNYSSAFLLEEVEIAAPVVPVTFSAYALDENMQVAGELSGEVAKVGYVAFTCSNTTATLEGTENAVAYIFDKANNSPVAESTLFMVGDLLGDGMQLAAMSFSTFTTPGTYVVYIPAGSFTINGVANEDIMSAEFTIPAPVIKNYVVESVEPANGTEVEAINEIVVKFTEDIALATDNMGNFIPVNLVDENDNVIELAVSDDVNVWSKVVLTPATPITAAGTYTLDLSQLQLNGGVCEGSYSWTVVEPVANTFIPSSYESTNKYVPSTLPGIKIWFDEAVVSAELAEGETSYGYVLNAAGERVLELDKKGYISGTLTYAQFTNNNYEAVETAGEYTVVVTAVITSASGTVHTYGEFKFTVEKAPVEVSRDVEFWGTVKSIPAEINLTINNADAIVLDETKKATLTCGGTVYEATATLNDNVITLAFSAEFVEGDYTFVIPAGLYTTDGEAGEEVYEEFTFKKPVPLKVIAIEPASGNVEKIESITIQFNQPVEASYMLEMNGYALMKSGWEATETVTYMILDANQAETVISTPGEYTINIADVTEMSLAEGETASYTWTIAENTQAPEVTELIDATKEYYLKSSWNYGMNSGYFTLGTKSGSNYGHAYMANDKSQAFKFTLVEDGDNKYYTLATEIENVTGGSYPAYVDCSHASNVNSNAMTASNIILELENATSSKYVIKTANGYLTAAMIDHGTDGYAYHVFSNGDRDNALVFSLVEKVTEAPVVAAPAIVEITPANGAEVASLSEIVITFDKAIKEIDTMNGIIKVKTSGSTSRAYGYSATISADGLTVTFPIGDDMGGTKTIDAAGEYTIEIPAGVVTSTDGAKSEAANYTFTIAEPTAIEGVDAEVENDVIYDLSGRRVAEITKAGIYIVNGKKVLVK